MIIRKLEKMDFRTLSIFIKTCRLMSFTQCAEEMDLPLSTVSKSVNKLEETLEAKLLERSTRKIELTDAGKIVLNRAIHLVEELNSLVVDVQELEQQVQGLLRVSAPPPMADFFSRNVLPNFMKQWPKVKISLEMSFAFEDLFIKELDVALRIGAIDDDRLIAKHIGEGHQILVATPEYLADKGEPQTPEELRHHQCLKMSFSPRDSFLTLMSPDKTMTFEANSHFFCDNIDVLKNMAVSGLGIIHAPVNNLVEELKSGKLVRVLPDWQSVPVPIYLVYRSGANKPRRVEAFLNYLLTMKHAISITPEQVLG